MSVIENPAAETAPRFSEGGKLSIWLDMSLDRVNNGLLEAIGAARPHRIEWLLPGVRTCPAPGWARPARAARFMRAGRLTTVPGAPKPVRAGRDDEDGRNLLNRSRARSVYQALEQALEANSGKAALIVAGVLTLTAAWRERSHPRDGLVMALRVGAVALAGKALFARFRTAVVAGGRPMTLSSQAAGAATASQAAVEAAVDDALDMTFPASDPPAWGCLARRRSEAEKG